MKEEKMVDFSKAIEELNSYKGSEKKKTLIYNNKRYLVKFPDPIREKNKNISYINNAFSEYVGSNVFKIAGFQTQNTILGTYLYNGKEKIVCGCEDFTDENHILYEFENIELSENPDKKIETELSDIMEIIEEMQNMSQIKINLDDNIKEKFWEMFIIDYLIENTNRNNGNWRILVNSNNKRAIFSPIYDCGSCLNPILDDEQIKQLSKTELKNLAVNCYSCMKENGKKINYVTYIGSLNNEECNRAVLRIYPKIDIKKIYNFIDDIDCMSQERKEFYKKIIELRYDIIKQVYDKLNKFNMEH